MSAGSHSMRQAVETAMETALASEKLCAAEREKLLLLEEDERALRSKIAASLGALEGINQHSQHLYEEVSIAEGRRSFSTSDSTLGLSRWEREHVEAESTGTGIVTNVKRLEARVERLAALLRRGRGEAPVAASARQTPHSLLSEPGTTASQSLCVYYDNSSCRFATTAAETGDAFTFGEILRQAARFWSIAADKCTLADLHGRTLPLSMCVPREHHRIVPHVQLLLCEATPLAPTERPPVAFDHTLDVDANAAKANPLTDLRKRRRRHDINWMRALMGVVNTFLIVTYATGIWLRHGGSDSHLLHRALRNALFIHPAGLREGKDNTTATFEEIDSIEEWWGWVNGPLRSVVATGNLPARCPPNFPVLFGSAQHGVFCSSDYSDAGVECGSEIASHICQLVPGLAPLSATCDSLDMCITAVGRFVIGQYNHIIGAPTLQQFRVEPFCTGENERVDDLGVSAGTDCTPKYDGSSKLLPGDPFSFDLTAAQRATPGFGECEPSEMGAFSSAHDTWKLSSIGCTFRAPLPPVVEHFDATAERLKALGWVDAQTRALVVTINVVNLNTDLYAVVRATCKPKVGNAMDCSWGVEVLRLLEDLLSAQTDSTWNRVMVVVDVITTVLVALNCAMLFAQWTSAICTFDAAPVMSYGSGDRGGNSALELAARRRRGKGHGAADPEERDDFAALDLMTEEDHEIDDRVHKPLIPARYVNRFKVAATWCVGMDGASGSGSLWNLIELGAACVYFLSWGPRLVYHTESLLAKERFVFTPQRSKYWRHNESAKLVRDYRTLLALDCVALCLMLLKSFRFLDQNPGVVRIVEVTRLAVRNISDAFYVLGVLLLAAAYLAYCAFGSSVEDFQDYESVFATMVKLAKPVLRPDLPDGVFVSWRNIFQGFAACTTLVLSIFARGYIISVLNHNYLQVARGAFKPDVEALLRGAGYTVARSGSGSGSSVLAGGGGGGGMREGRL